MAGSPEHGGEFADGKGAATNFYGPMDITVDSNNNILIAEYCNLVSR